MGLRAANLSTAPHVSRFPLLSSRAPSAALRGGSTADDTSLHGNSGHRCRLRANTLFGLCRLSLIARAGAPAVAVALWLLWSAQADLGDAWHCHLPFQVAMCKVIWFTS
jgi:hypothetical protein